MFYNILFGGAAGLGIETVATIFEKIAQKNGYEVYSHKDYMSRVRGGHNFVQIRFGDQGLFSHHDALDVIVALDKETIKQHKDSLNEKGLILCDKEIDLEDHIGIHLPLKQTAQDIGEVRAMGSVALGALVHIFDMDLVKAEEAVEKYFSGDVLSANLQALISGFDMEKVRFEKLKTKETEKILINGNQAIALGALAAGCKLYTAYPMSPSTTIMNYLASKMKDGAIVVEQVEDEIAAINMAIGSSYAGLRSMTGTSGGGFCLMVEALGLTSLMEIPLVIANIQRPGPATGFATRTEQADLRFAIHAAQGEFPRMVIAVRDPEDAFYQTARAFNLADKYQIPVILLGDQYLADAAKTCKPFNFDKITIDKHLAESVDYPAEGIRYKRYQYSEDGISPRLVPGKQPGVTVMMDSHEHDEYGHITESAEIRIKMNNKRLMKEQLLQKELIEPETIGLETGSLLVLAWGSTYGAIKEAVTQLNEEGFQVGALVFGDIYPLPTGKLNRLAGQFKQILNVEQNATGQLAGLIAEKTGIKCHKSILKYDGRQISSPEVYYQLKEVLQHV